MNKTVSTILLILVFLIIYFLQANFFNWFTIAGVKPNLFVIFVLFISLFTDIKIGTIFGISIGIFLDILTGRSIGPSTVMYGIIGLVGGYFNRSFSKDSKITIILMVALSTFIYELGSYIFSIAQLAIQIEILGFLKILVIEILYNVILTIILSTTIQKMGYKIEEVFKGQKILTRYF